jgi:hypothetical protein
VPRCLQLLLIVLLNYSSYQKHMYGMLTGAELRSGCHCSASL